MTSTGADTYTGLTIVRTVADELIEQAQAKADIQAAEFAPGELLALVQRIKCLLQRENAVLVAHYYTAPELQQLADETHCAMIVVDHRTRNRCRTDNIAERRLIAHNALAKTKLLL